MTSSYFEPGKRRSRKRRRPLWYHLLSSALPLAYLLTFVLVAAMLYRLAVWWLFGVRVWF